MVSKTSLDIDRVFHALAHPARRDMLRRLADGECNLTQLATPLSMSFPAASKHVRVLEQAALVHRRVEGRTHICTINAAPLKQVADWAEDYRRLWEQRLDRLAAYLDELTASVQDAAPTAQAPIAPKSGRRTSNGENS